MTESNKSSIEYPLNPMPKAVVVGASSGIGAATARKLAAEGYQVALLARRKDLLKALCEEINQRHGEIRAVAYPHDVTKFKEIPTLFQQILQDMQTIDVFIYNSGVQYASGMSEFDFGKDLPTLEVNLLGGIAWLGQAATLFDRMESGHLVGISSVAGDRGRIANPSYHAAKSGLSTYLESLRNRLSRKGVHVLTIKPGYVQTDLLPPGSPLPAITPEQAADAIYKGIKRRKTVVYTPGWWRLIMLVVTHVPSFIFRRMSF